MTISDEQLRRIAGDGHYHGVDCNFRPCRTDLARELVKARGDLADQRALTESHGAAWAESRREATALRAEVERLRGAVQFARGEFLEMHHTEEIRARDAGRTSSPEFAVLAGRMEAALADSPEPADPEDYHR